MTQALMSRGRSPRRGPRADVAEMPAGRRSPGSRSLDKWEEYIGQNDKLPVAVCGTGVSPRALHDQIYAQYPAMKKNNPWGA